MQVKAKQVIHINQPSHLKNNPAGKNIVIQQLQLMNLSASECSSGCESGWTRYLDQFSNSTDPYSRTFVEGKGVYVDEDRDDEDLSMVSDASSGPPHFQEYQDRAFENQCYGYSSVPEQKRKNKQKSRAKEIIRGKKQQSLSFDDDTASSPICHFSQGNVTHHPGDHSPDQEHASSFSQVFSAAHFESKSTSKKKFGLFKPTTKGESGSFLGRKRH